MSKIKMMCPFSSKLCRDCTYYRARHYYLGYCRKYRGFIGDKEEMAKPLRANQNKKFEIPLVIRSRAIDPFLIDRE